MIPGPSADFAPPSNDRIGISLSMLMHGVATAVAHVCASGVWTRLEVVKADLRKGHFYLEVGERNPSGELVATARATIWRSTADRIVPAFERNTGVRLGAGIKLLVRARPMVHPLYGLSLNIDAIDPNFTLGDLEAKKHEIRQQLDALGVWDANRRLTSPWDYNTILVVAPQNAAGLGDFRAEADRLEQHGVCRFIYITSRFQGEGAAQEIKQTLLAALSDWHEDNSTPPDAVVIIRGGGAVNDLAWLNDFELARCLCELNVPVLTGIGHERDSTLLDEVAHQAFDTPSKVIMGIESVIRQRSQEALDAFSHIRHRALTQLSGAKIDAAHAWRTVGSESRRIVRDAASRAQALMREIAGQGPESTLARGFALVKNNTTGKPVMSVAQATGPNMALDIYFRDGSVTATTAAAKSTKLEV